jgi:uncharacterized iron-regulated membrane protein
VSHRWLGLIAGVLFCVFGLTGSILVFRPQIENWFLPAPQRVAGCAGGIDWDRAAHDVEAFAHSPIERIHVPAAPDTRYRFRIGGSRDGGAHPQVIYDACSARISGVMNLPWLDWAVDLHHNLLLGRDGKWYAGWVGAGLLFISVGGIVLWLLSSPSLHRLLRIRGGLAMPRDLHVTAGVAAGSLLLLSSFTSLWLSFPQAMRGAVSFFSGGANEVRAPRKARKARPAAEAACAPLSQIAHAAQDAIPGGHLREIRVPTDCGNVQIRMWRAGDFRTTGDNVVMVSGATGAVLSADLYANRPTVSRFNQAMTGLHHAEWSGLGVRALYGIAGLTAVVLFFTGVLAWWLPKRRAAQARATARLRPHSAAVPNPS